MESKSPFDGRTIFVVLVCMAIWFGWQQYLEKKYPQPVEQKTSQTGDQKSNVATETARVETVSQGATPAAASANKSSKPIPEKKWEYEDNNWKVTVSSKGGRVAEVLLKKYTGPDGKPVALVSENEPGYLLTDVQGSSLVSFDTENFALESSSKEAVQLVASKNGVTVKKTLTLIPEKYLIKAQVSVAGPPGTLKNINISVSQPVPSDKSSSGPASFLTRGAGQELQEYFFSHGTKTNRHQVAPKSSVEKAYDQTQFASLGSRYFTTLLFNRSNVLPMGVAERKNDNSALELRYPVLDNNSTVSLQADLFAGPKLLSQLKQVDEQAAQLVDFGMFSWIALPILELMKILFNVLKNYGLAIIVLTILVRLITFPFTYVSLKSMKEMQRLKPEMDRLREVYKNDKQAMNLELMKLMKENKVNPAGGCLPILLQIPIFVALYQVLQNSIELYRSPFFGWIHDLSMKDPFYILPVLMCITMVVQQKLTPSTMDPAQAKAMMVMPLVFGLMMMSLPSGLTLYMFVSALFGIIQQILMMQDRSKNPPVAVMRRT